MWPTANVPDRGRELSKAHRPESGGIDLQSAVQTYPSFVSTGQRTHGPRHPDPNTNGKSPGLWTTSHGFCGQEKGGKRYGGGGEFAKQAKQWQAVKVPNGGDKSRSGARKNELLLGGQVKGKLNPLWVSQLMGVPVGWCDIEWTSFDCSATASSPPRQNSHLEPYGRH